MTKRNTVVTIKGQPLPTEQTPEARMSELVRGLVQADPEDRKKAILAGLASEVQRAQCAAGRGGRSRRPQPAMTPRYSQRTVELATEAVLRHMERNRKVSPHRKVSNL